MTTLNSKGNGEQKPESPVIEGINSGGFFNEQSVKGGCSVRVAVRVRPLMGREIAASESSCVQCDQKKNSIVVGLDKQFTFDKVFGSDTRQEEIFDVCVKNLVLGSFAGYNSTVLAYGQTGSGKTFTMGTDAALAVSKEQQGIIPRVIQLIFDEVEKKKATKEFVIKVSFIEIYNEEIRDLLDPQGQNKIAIRELTRGMPSLCGQTEERVIDYEGLFKLLERGALHRRTRSTLMNECSSRSHAIFTINIEQHLIEDLYPKEAPAAPATTGEGNGETQEFMTAKFHFVDLAGSERIKKTGAEGDSMHEGISINKALFVLGKVINALTDETGRSTYRPYRESCLTRILQDSLGGNARTTMVACVSPAESNQEESLSTLLYACKARCIKNKPVVNRDPNSTLIHQLQQQVCDLQRELVRFRKGGSVPCPMSPGDASPREFAPDKDLMAEIASHKRQNEGLKASLLQSEEQCRKKTIEYLTVEKERDMLKLSNEKLRAALEKTPGAGPIADLSMPATGEELGLLEGYKKQIAELQDEGKKKAQEFTELRLKYEEECKNNNLQSEQMIKLNQELVQMKRVVVKMRRGEGKAGREVAHSAREADVGEPSVVLGSGPWLSPELDEQLKEVNEIFINELAQSLGSLIPENSKPSTETESSTAPTGDTAEKSEAKTEDEVVVNNEDEPAEETAIEEEKIPDDLNKTMKESLNKVDVDIQEREKMLEQIKEKHQEMQKNLIAIMEQQYHKKVEELEREVDKLRTDQEKAMQIAPKDNRSGIESQYKKKISEYEGKIKEYRKSEAQQQKLLKQTSEQESKIQLLTDEILKMKQQKVEMARQMRKDRENYEKTRRAQAKESLRLKQETIRQKLTINKLTKEKERANKMKETIRRERKPTLNLPPKEQLASYRTLIDEFTNRLVSLRQESAQLQREELKQHEIKARLDLAYKELYKLKLEIEKFAYAKKELNPDKDYDVIKQLDEAIEKGQKQSGELQTSIDNMETTLQYHEEKSVRIDQTRSRLRTQLASIVGKGRVKSAKDINDVLTVLFEVLAEEKLSREEKIAKSQNDSVTIDSLNENINRLTAEYKLLQEDHQSEMAKMVQMFDVKEQALKAEINLLRGDHTEPNITTMELATVVKKAVSCPETKARQEGTKEKGDDKESAKFLKKELEEYKKRNTDIMKENSALRGQIIGLTGQNEKLSKNTMNLTRKVDDLSSKLKKNDVKPALITATPKFVSLKEQRLTRKTKLMEHAYPRIGTPDKNDQAADTAPFPPTADPKEEEKKPNTVSSTLPSESSQFRTTIGSSIGLKSTTAKLVMCKPTVTKQPKYALAEELKRSVAAMDMAERSKSPIEIRTDEPPEELPLETIVKVRTNTSPENKSSKPMGFQGAASHSLSSAGSHSSSFITTIPQPVPESNRWKCIHSEELHSFGIFSLVSFEHYLISGSNVIKLWDINKKATVAELPSTISRCLYVVPQQKLLVGTDEQQGAVHFWSLPDLSLVRTLETGLDSVRALYTDKNILFVGGSGTAGALQLWDLNMMGKLCEREKNPDKDIFSIFCRKSVIYYGGRNRNICRVNLDTLESMAPLDPTHYGAVNALTNLGDTLISGCREYLLRAWDYETGKQKYSEAKRTTTLNAVQTDKEEQMLYAAGKDGHIKVWKIKEDKLQDVADLISHTKSVNGLARIPTSTAKAFASAGDDKTVKIWRYSE